MHSTGFSSCPYYIFDINSSIAIQTHYPLSDYFYFIYKNKDRPVILQNHPGKSNIISVSFYRDSRNNVILKSSAPSLSLVQTIFHGLISGFPSQ